MERPVEGFPTLRRSQARSSPCRFLGNNYVLWLIITNRSSGIVGTSVYVSYTRSGTSFSRERVQLASTTKMDRLVNLLAERILSFSHPALSFFSYTRTLGATLVSRFIA